MLVLRYSDDGRGLDMEKIKSKAGWEIECAEKQADEQIIENIFSCGFSTKDKITEISGRGVGLSAVRDMIIQSGGFIEIKFTEERGTQQNNYRPFYFVITLPV